MEAYMTLDASKKGGSEDFLKLFNEIDKLYSDSKKDISNLRPEVAEKVAQKNEANKKKADEKEKQLLNRYPKDSREHRYIVLILDNIKTRRGIIIQNEKKHEEEDSQKEKYINHYKAKQCFNQKLYEDILPYCQLAYLYEQNGVAEEHALKLSLVFDTLDDIIKYLNVESKQNKKHDNETEQENSHLVIHDACLFALPEMDMFTPTQWEEWKKLCKRNMNNAEFKKILPKANELEAMINQHFSPEKKPHEVKERNNEMLRNIERVNKAVKDFASRAATLNTQEEKEYTEKIKELSTLRTMLFEECKGLPLKDMDIDYIIAFNEKYLVDSSEAYRYMLSQGLRKQDYDKFVALTRRDDDVQIPNIKIQGSDLEPPVEGFYLMKVPVLDELQAARAACLGKLTDCCQSLSGELGEPCVKHGLTSPYGGFYVICKGNLEHPKVEDFVLGQCWAWRAKTKERKQGAIVFDSIETANRDPFTKEAVSRFFNALAKELVKHEHTDKVVCGANSGISSDVGFDAELNQKEVFEDYRGYNDSVFQRVLEDRNAPFYFFNTDPEKAKETLRLATEAFEKYAPIIESNYLCQLLNFISLQPYSVESEVLRDKLQNIAKSFGKEKELTDILSQISAFIKLSSFSYKTIDDLIKGIDNHTFSTKILNKDQYTILNQLICLYATNQNDSLTTMIDTLLDKKNIDTNQPNKDGQTPFMFAAQSLNMELCKKLVEKGADCRAFNIHHENVALIFYKTLKTLKTLRHLISTPEKYERTKSFLIELILEFKLDINFGERNGETLLMKLAKTSNDLSFVDKIINLGAKVDMKDDLDNTPLIHGIKKSNTDFCLHLITKHKANVNIKNSDEDTALHWAANRRLINVCQALINAGADLNAENESGDTPLGVALKNNHIDICLALIDAGADLNTKNKNGDTPLGLALKNNNIDICLTLIDAGADTNNVDGRNLLMKLSETSYDLSFVDKIINLGTKVDTKNDLGITALMSGILRDNTAFCLHLITKHKPDVNIKDTYEETALYWAVKKRSLDVFQALIKAGADINARNKKGDTPLMVAIRTNSIQFCQALIDAGADLNAENNDHMTSLAYACKLGLSDVALALIEKGANISESFLNIVEKSDNIAFKEAIQGAIKQKENRRASSVTPFLKIHLSEDDSSKPTDESKSKLKKS